MRKTALSLIIIIIIAAFPAASAAQYFGGCQSRLIHSFRQIQHVVHDDSMIHALRARPAIARAAVHAIRGAIRLSRLINSIDTHISRNPQLVADPKVRSEMCLAARAMHDYSASLRGLVETGEKLERESVTLRADGVGPGPRERAEEARSQTITQSRTSSREHSKSVQRSHSEMWTHTKSDSYAAAAAREVDHVQTFSHSLSDQSSVSAARGWVYTTQQTLLCPPAGCPSGPGTWRVMRQDGLCTQSMGCYPPHESSISPPTRGAARRIVNRTDAAAAAARRGVSGRRLRAQVRARLADARARVSRGH